MFKRTLAMIAGVVLLATGATDSRAAGLTLDPTLIVDATPFATVQAADILAGTDGSAIDLFGAFTAGGTSDAGDNVTVTNGTGSFTLSVTDSVFSDLLTGTEQDSIFMEDAVGDDLIEVLFSRDSGSLTSAAFVLASITGEFGSDPLGASGPSTLPFGLGVPASITLTAVNQIPLPAGIVLLLTALGGLVLVRRRTIG
ncbi:MAG: VPLPA-CTERM sorting domain-containing protein [Pseudomonadota bacterium]